MSELTPPARLNPGTPLVIKGVSKQYHGRTVLNALDLHIPSGQFVAVVGRSGCGKVPCCDCWPVWKHQAAGICWPEAPRSAMHAKIFV